MPTSSRPVAGPKPSPSQTAVYVWPRAATIAVVTALIYWNSLSAPFTFDDVFSVQLNKQIQHLWPLSAVLSPWQPDQPVAGRPLVTLSLALNYAVGELSVRGYHVANVTFHVLCALVLFAVVRQTLRLPSFARQFTDRAATEIGFVGALIWAVHPLNTEAVDYISARTESMMGLFFLLTVYTSIRGAENARWLWLSALSCAAGMACKETMAVAPVVVLLYDRTYLFGSFTEAMRRRWKFYLGLSASWIGLAALLWWGPRSETAGFSVDVTPRTYLLNQAPLIARYLRLTFWPTGLVLDYGYPRPVTPSDVVPYVLIILALLTATVIAMIRWPRVGFLGGSFFAILAPTSSFVPIATEVGAERRMYLPLAAVVVLVVLAGYRFSEYLSRRLRARTASAGVAATAVVVCSVLALGTVRRNAEYLSGLTLWSTDLERWPQSRAHRNLAAELKVAGYRDEVVYHMREAARDEPDARYGLGMELFDQGKYTEAVEELQHFLRDRPTKSKIMLARGLLARAYDAQGKPAAAADEFREMLKATPSDVDLWNSLGVALQRAHQTEEAGEAFHRAVELNPKNAAAQRNLAGFLLDQQDFDGALSHADVAVQLTPRDSLAHTVRGLALVAHLRLEDAVREFETALEIDPSDQQTRGYLERTRKLSQSK